MTSKRDIKVLTELLNLEGMKVVSHRQYKGLGVILQIESVSNESICPRCGIKTRQLHQNHKYIIKDLPWGEQQLFLEINKRQFKCKKCQKPFTEDLHFVGKRRKYTKRLANKTVEEVLKSDVRTVARTNNLTTREIEKMLEDASKGNME
ncbi:MAG: transposase [Rivularia sp. (in: Bacteria)]|nr:transposase [Rivularia sp. MS3]